MDRMTGATAGLFGAWLVHDVEELFTLRETSRKIASRLPRALPLPAGWREHGVPQRQVVTGIPVMGVVMAAAAVEGYRSSGRSPFYQTVLLGFGLHGIGHLAVAAGLRGYASGAATSPTVVIPFWLAATHHLDACGVPARRSLLAAAVSIPVAIGSAHALAHLMTRAASSVRPDGSGPNGPARWPRRDGGLSAWSTPSRRSGSCP